MSVEGMDPRVEAAGAALWPDVWGSESTASAWMDAWRERVVKALAAADRVDPLRVVLGDLHDLLDSDEARAARELLGEGTT